MMAIDRGERPISRSSNVEAARAIHWATVGPDLTIGSIPDGGGHPHRRKQKKPA
jgi:hypothetical protein